MGDITKGLIDASSLEVIKSLTETKKGLIELIKSPDVTDELKDALLEHIVSIDNSLINGIKDILPVLIYKDVKKKLKENKKDIQELDKKVNE